MSTTGSGSGIGKKAVNEVPGADRVSSKALPEVINAANETKSPTELPSESSYAKKQERGVLGPKDIEAGITELDHDVASHIFAPVGIASPYNANTTEKLYAQIKNKPEYKTVVAALNEYVANPVAQNLAGFNNKLTAFEQTNPYGNMLEVLFLVFRESIQDTNEDKKYFLLKLQEYNKMAEDLSEYLRTLVDASARLSSASNGQKYPEKVSIPVEIRTYDLQGLGSDGHLQFKMETRQLDRAGLNDAIKQIEADQETVRNRRQMSSTAFQNFDQKSNQLYNLMSSVLKTTNEMRSGVIRNML